MLVVVLVAASLWGALVADFSSTAYERTDGGGFRRVAGGSKPPLGLLFRVTRGDYNTDEISFNDITAERPFSRSSISIIDISGTTLSRRLAHAVAQSVRKLPDLEWVDVRIVGEPLDVQRMGDLILVIEEFQAKQTWLVNWTTHHRVHMGYIPEYGTGEPVIGGGPRSVMWEIEATQQFFGTPWRAAEGVAENIASAMDLAAALERAAEKHAPTHAVPPMLLPAAFEGPGEKAVAAATGLESPPLLRGVRAGVQGEALWRYEGSDAALRLVHAAEALERDGWTRLPGGSRSPEGDLHRTGVTRGSESVEWVYENGRTSILQEEWWSSRRLADGSRSAPVHHVRGPELPPVLWIHYRNEMTADQLRSTWTAAQADGADTAEAFVSNLSKPQRALLGIPEPSGTQ